MRASLLVLLLLLAAGSALAQTALSPQEQAAARAELQVRIRGVEAALSRINAEQQSVYQQFQMVQEMRRNERQDLLNPGQGYTPPTWIPNYAIPNYDDVVRDKQTRESRLHYYASQMDRLYARYRELEEQKRPLLEQLAELTAQR